MWKPPKAGTLRYAAHTLGQPVPSLTANEHQASCFTILHPAVRQVEYVFSDKTGTLTANEMQLRMIAVKGVAYGNMQWR